MDISLKDRKLKPISSYDKRGLKTGLRLDQKVDEIDLKIISLLQEDSRSSFNQIAANLGIVVGTVHNHEKNLEDEGILKGYTIILDPT